MEHMGQESLNWLEMNASVANATGQSRCWRTGAGEAACWGALPEGLGDMGRYISQSTSLNAHSTVVQLLVDQL